MYLNLIQLAESFGVSENVVQDWVHHEGLPHTLDRGRLLFDRTQVTTWAASRGLAAQAGFLAPQTPTAPWRLEQLLRTGGIWRNLAASEVPGVFEKVVGLLPGTTPVIRQLLIQRLGAEKGVTFAPVGGGFALPHPGTRIAFGRDSGVVAVLLLREALLLTEPAPDDLPITRLIFFIAPSSRAHLDLLGRLSRLLARGPFRDLLTQGASDAEIFRAAANADAAGPAPIAREPKS